jgi:hypothetical protein
MDLLRRTGVSARGIAFLAVLALLFFSPAGLSAQSEEKAKSDKQEKSEKDKDKKDQKAESDEEQGSTRLRIEVVAGEKDEPVDSASVYVRFVRPRTFGKDKKIEMNVKTNRNGVAVIPIVPRGKVTIQVIAAGWKTFGQWYDIDKAEQTVHIKLEKPPRWY